MKSSDVIQLALERICQLENINERIQTELNIHEHYMRVLNKMNPIRSNDGCEAANDLTKMLQEVHIELMKSEHHKEVQDHLKKCREEMTMTATFDKKDLADFINQQDGRSIKVHDTLKDITETLDKATEEICHAEENSEAVDGGSEEVSDDLSIDGYDRRRAKKSRLKYS